MLQIKDVKKEYITGDLHQTALAGVSLNLRESELVAILGPSGSGKSTLLNIIGGLDQYDSGDLIINGISTKKYTDRDWDSYRNHSVGFVFQSYNLIPHQTVLANVELALTISGVPRSQRRKRAAKALEEVGLGDQLHKKPSQMSGGQMQRVAIARALVNNPSILLADEPTGALDSETSIQVMELLKEVSRDRLVVMVTHNPELAEQYADRIVRVRDGKLIGDSNPYEVDETQLAQPEHKNMGKASMSFFSALALSFNNLRSKKGRTLLTAFAGSIGIIGIALIMSLSVGFQRYIDTVQEDTLASNPLSLQSETADFMSFLMPGAGGASAGESGESAPSRVEESPALTSMFQHFGANDLGAFKAHLEAHMDEIGDTLNSVQYGYNITPRVYIKQNDGCRQVNPSSLFRDLTGNELISAMMDVSAFQEMTDDSRLLDEQYQVLEGRWPENHDELVLVLPDSGHLSDHIAYTLGLKELDSLEEMIQLLFDDAEIPPPGELKQWSYDELLQTTFQLISVPDLYRYNEEYQVWEDMSEDPEYVSRLVEDGLTLKVVGIVSPRPGSPATALSPGMAYPSSLTRYIVEQAAGTRIVQEQLANMDVNVFTGAPFNAPAEEKPLDFQDLISIDSDAISSAFGIDVDEDAIVELMEKHLAQLGDSADVDTSGAEQAFLSALSDFTRQMLGDYISGHAGEDGYAVITLDDLVPMTDAYFASGLPEERLTRLAETYSMETQDFLNVFKPMMVGLMTEYIAENASGTPAPAPAAPAPASAPADPGETESAQISTAPVENVTVPAEPVEVPVETTSPAPAETQPVQPQATEPVPPVTEAPPTVPETSVPDMTVPETSLPNPEIDIRPEDFSVRMNPVDADRLVAGFAENPIVQGTTAIMGQTMMRPQILENLMKKAAAFGDVLADYFADSIHVDGDKIRGAFHFNMSEDEMKRLMDALSARNQEQTAQLNLSMLGYADMAVPDSMYLYFKDFDSKETFLQFLADYNESMETSGQEEKVIRYTDMTAMMMDSVRTIINTVSYSLIAFVAVSLLVSSIMIGIITYISVMERTKEIGILRAMGASKHNIAQVFNAETFIIGLCSGLLGVGISLIMLIPGNRLIHSLMDNELITAYLPLINSAALIFISMLLTLLGGLIPSHQAAKKDPVVALRSE